MKTIKHKANSTATKKYPIEGALPSGWLSVEAFKTSRNNNNNHDKPAVQKSVTCSAQTWNHDHIF